MAWWIPRQARSVRMPLLLLGADTLRKSLPSLLSAAVLPLPSWSSSRCAHMHVRACRQTNEEACSKHASENVAWHGINMNHSWTRMLKVETKITNGCHCIGNT